MGKLKSLKALVKRVKKSNPRNDKESKIMFTASGWGHLKAKKGAKIKHRKGGRTLSKDTTKVFKKLLRVN